MHCKEKFDNTAPLETVQGRIMLVLFTNRKSRGYLSNSWALVLDLRVAAVKST